MNNGCGWVHVRCRGDEDRGVSSIIKGLNQDVSMLESGDVGLGFNGARERLMPDDNASAIVVTQEDESFDEVPWTQEQMDILDYHASPGDLICVNALAGCGKTTTIALLCNRLHQEDNIILYLVFGKKAEEEARNSNKFPKEDMAILTSHACVRRHYFGIANFMKCQPEADYSPDDISATLRLEMFVRQTFPNLHPHKQAKRVRTIAGYIKKTLGNFQASTDRRVKEKHVWWYAKKQGISKRTEWRQKVPPSFYASSAQTIFNEIHVRCKRIRDCGEERKVPHDAYMKVAQLEALSLPYDVIAVDEAQDMTPCQAELFWGDRGSKIIYLFGDQWQQLYRFRGAGDSFKLARILRDAESFSLTGSFRFGTEIARLATLTLQYGGGGEVTGRATLPGEIKGDSSFSKGVVICRSNNGMYNYLLHNGSTIGRWTFLKPTSKPPEATRIILDLERFLLGESESFKWKGDTFTDKEEMRDYCDDGDDSELRKNVALLDMLIENETRVHDFYSMIRESFIPLNKDTSIDDFDGTILTTCHGAKGLEFDDVYVHDDFSFSVLMESSDFLNRPRLCDEINLIYVAVTRAKKRVYLSEEARAFFEHINPNKYISDVSLRVMRRRWEEEWERFSSDNVEIESEADIPWPSGLSSNNPFFLDREMNENEQKSYVRHMFRRFHPDKFLSKYKYRMKELCKEKSGEIIDKLHEYLQKAKYIYVLLQSPDE